MEFKKGDVCSLEVVVQYADHGSTLIKIESAKAAHTVPTSSLTLLRRAPVDLATCELPVEVMWEYSRLPVKMIARGKTYAIIEVPGEVKERSVLLDILRPLDAPAPDKSEVERLRESIKQQIAAVETVDGLYSEVEDENSRLRAALRRIVKLDIPIDIVDEMNPLARMAVMVAREALASSTPTCPPGHIMIGDRAVPRGMTEAPEMYAEYWAPCAGKAGHPMSVRHMWVDDDIDRVCLLAGLAHSTEAAARTHAEALIALSAKREG